MLAQGPNPCPSNDNVGNHHQPLEHMYKTDASKHAVAKLTWKKKNRYRSRLDNPIRGSPTSCPHWSASQRSRRLRVNDNPLAKYFRPGPWQDGRKDVTRSTHAATLQRTPATEGHNQRGKGPTEQTPSFERLVTHTQCAHRFSKGLMYTARPEWALSGMLSEPVGL